MKRLALYFAFFIGPTFALTAACGDDAKPSTDAASDVTADIATPDIALEDGTATDVGEDITPDAGPSDAAPDTVGPLVWPWPVAPTEVPADASWRDRFFFPEDPFAVFTWSEAPLPPWLKFSVLTADPETLIVQDSNSFAFHFDFARAHLPPFAIATPDSFDQQTLYHVGKVAILGGILFAPPAPSEGGLDLRPREIGVQLVAQDPLPTHVAIRMLRLVEGGLDVSDDRNRPTIFYMPTFEQQASAELDRQAYEAAGFPLSSPARWVNGNVCYAPGWAIGRLVRVAPDAIDAAWAAGSLTSTDILVTDSIPAEVPPVAGIVSFGPSTPLSHVAILATNLEIPFVFAAEASTRAAIEALLGETVALRARQPNTGSFSFGGCDVDAVRMTGFDGALSQDDIDSIVALKSPRPIELAPIVPAGMITHPTDTLTTADIGAYGGKASNFGLLVRTIPDHVPTPSLAISADPFFRFLDQRPDGQTPTLRELIADHLAGITWPLADPQAAETALAAVRALVKGPTTRLTPTDEASLIAALAPFKPTDRIRFRSSTNVEDSAFFTGAGLYDSFSGCLADDTDDDETGPSRCDPDRDSERGVFRAIKKVYASFWNTNAYLERLRHGVDESRAFMAILAHPSYPDEDELANGVATVIMGGGSRRVVVTTQKGAVSVTNPTAGSQPEVVTASIWGTNIWKELLQRSSLVLLGTTVMTWEDDYDTLIGLLNQVSEAWAATLPSGTRFALDFEFKKVRPGRLEIKQVRSLPLPSTSAEQTPWLLPNPSPKTLCVYQGEAGTALGIHRTKSKITISNRGLWLQSRALEATFWRDWQVEAAWDGARHTFGGDPTTLTAFSHTAPTIGMGDQTTADSFAWRPDTTTREAMTWSLLSVFPWRVSEATVPLLTLDDGTFYVRLGFTRPLYDPDEWNGGVSSEATARLGPCPDDEVLTDRHSHRAVTFDGPDGIAFDVAFYWPPPPTGVVAGYTAPLVKWDRTVITGLTPEPFELHGYWSQTYRPGHHNFTETYVFEPRLEEGIAPTVLSALAAADIVVIRVEGGWQTPTIEVEGRDGRWRTLQAGE